MKIALATTTINVPVALKLYRALDPDVRFFVAGDLKTPPEAKAFVNSLGNAVYLTPEMQKAWRCSELIGWNCIQRRNIAILEALKWGADIIVFWDDDNLPVTPDYFGEFCRALRKTDGLAVSGTNGWFDVGQLLTPPVPHRGLPIEHRNESFTVSPITGVRVGVAAGICIGDPDILSIDRISRAPICHGVSELLRAGVVVDPMLSWTVFNSQNTAFIRELAPAMFLPPGIGRYDDIVASLVCQRVMRETGHVTHFGPPMIWQSRNPHNLVRDLKDEMWGMENIGFVAEYLDAKFEEETPLGLTRAIYSYFSETTFFPKNAWSAAMAWCDDVREAMNG